MDAKLLFGVLVLPVLLPLTALADVWQDPETKVNYEYTVGESKASVKSGFFDAGSPDVTGDIAILSSFTVDDNEYAVTSIGDYAFNGCVGLTGVTIPEGVTSIGISAFNGCVGLTGVTIPECVTSIGISAFNGCVGLTSVIIPKGIYTIESNTFCGCTGLREVIIGEGVTSIGFSAFSFCTSLTSVLLPSSVVIIHARAFENCSALPYINIPSYVVYIEDNVFSNCTSLLSVDIPKGVKSIADLTFYGCTSLTSVSIPEGVTSIGQYSFLDCTSLASVTIPSSVRNIGDCAFMGCESLAKVTSYVSDPFKIDVSVFKQSKQGDFTNAILYVPKGTKGKYEATEGWKNFQTIRNMDQPKGDVNDDGVVDVADIASVISVMAAVGGQAQGAAPTTEWADVNGDGVVDVADITAIVIVMASEDDNTPEEKVYTTCPDDHHPHAIDLGLPSGTKWACCNLGASNPEKYGDYYAWGETQIQLYSYYVWDTYKYNNVDIGSDIAGTEYDAATVNWGAPWQMPSMAQIQELMDNTTSIWATQRGVNGRVFTGSNGCAIFLPASGLMQSQQRHNQGTWGFYWSSTSGIHLGFYSDNMYASHFSPWTGFSVRPVR